MSRRRNAASKGAGPAARGRGSGSPRGVTVTEARDLLRSHDGVVEGTYYGYPSFLVNARFLARFRDDDTVLVLQLSSIYDRDFLMQADAQAFFFTEHYRNSAAVLVRLSAVSRPMLTETISDAWTHVSALPPPRQRSGTKGRATSRRGKT